jgi:hypothetical protein
MDELHLFIYGEKCFEFSEKKNREDTPHFYRFPAA